MKPNKKQKNKKKQNQGLSGNVDCQLTSKPGVPAAPWGENISTD